MFIDNNWYGNRYILSRYSKVIDKATLASLQHGMLLSNFTAGDDLKGKKSYGNRTFEYFPWLVWNDYIYRKAKNFNVNNVHVIGAPIVYLDKILKKYGTLEKIPVTHKTYNKLKGIANYKRQAPSKIIKEFIWLLDTDSSKK